LHTSPSAPSSEVVTAGRVESRTHALAPRRVLAQARAWWLRLDPAWRLAFWLLLVMRIGLGLIGFIAASMVKPPYYADGAYLTVTGPTPWIYIISIWQRWDARWYELIAQSGYHNGSGTDAFFPLYPLLTRGVSLLTFGHNPGGNVIWAQLVVSSIAFFFAVGLLYKLMRLDVGPVTAQLAVLLLVFFPTGFFLLAPYTESLYLALSVGAFYLARRGHPWAAGLVGFAAALTRTQGVLLAPALAWEYIRQRRRHGKWPGTALLAAGLPVLALVVFTEYLHRSVGDPASALAIQEAWGYAITAPWDAMAASWDNVRLSSNLPEALNFVSLIGFGLLVVWMVRRRLPFSYVLYSVPYLGVLFFRKMYYSPLLSDSRFTLMLFPCFLVLAMWLARRPWLAGSWLLVSILFQVGLLEIYIYWLFAG
jgi:hypothetical protein